jgi:hypothetical protein
MQLRRLIGPAFIGLALVSKADPLIVIPNQMPVFITAQAEIRQDDNIFLTDNANESDTIFVLRPGLNAVYRGAATEANFLAQQQFIRYASNSQLDSELLNLAAGISHGQPRSNWSLRSTYKEIDQNNFSIRNIDQTVRRDVLQVDAAGELSTTAKTSIGVGAGFDETDYREPGFVGYEAWTVPVDVYYAVSPKLDLSVGYRFRKTESEFSGNDSRDHFANIGARGRFTAKLDGQLRVGYTQRDPERGSQSSLLGVASSLNYTFSPKTVLSLSVSNDFNNSASGVSQRSLRVSAGGRFSPDINWSLFTDLSFESANYLGTFTRRDDFWSGVVGVTYLASASLSFDVAYIYRRSESDVRFVNFDNNIVTFSASLRF